MATKNDGGPVLPEVQKAKRPNGNKTRLQRVPGMRLRDYFAAQAMNAMLGAYPCGAIGMEIDFQAISGDSYTAADAMLAAREV